MERVKGIEPSSQSCGSRDLPLDRAQPSTDLAWFSGDDARRQQSQSAAARTQGKRTEREEHQAEARTQEEDLGQGQGLGT